MTISKEKKIVTGLALAFAVLIFVALMLLGSATEQRKTVAWVAHTRDVLEKINEVVTYLSDAENARRGYALSGHDVYLEHHTNRVGHVQTALRELRELTQDDPHQSAACDQLEEMIRQRLMTFANSIKTRKEDGLDVSAQTTFMEQGQQAMVLIRRLVAQMTTEERARLKERQAIQDRNTEGTAGFAVLVSLVALALFATLFVLFARANRRRHRAEELLHQTNLELEQRVQQRTAELSQTVEKVAWLASFPESNPDPVIELDLANRTIDYANPFARLVFPDLEGQGLRHPWLAGLEEVAKPLLDGETTAVRRELVLGDRCYAQTISHIPEARRLRVYSSDITEGKRVEEALRESQGSMAAAQQVAHFGTWDVDLISVEDLNRSTLRWSDECYRIFGLNPGEVAVTRDLFYSLVHPEDREAVKSVVAEAVRQKQQYFIEHRIVLRNGELRHVREDGQVFCDKKSGRPLKMVGTAQDITARKLAEAKLHTQLNRLDLLNRITRAVGERQDLPSIFQVVIRSLEDNLPIDFGCICRYEPVAGTLSVTSVGVRSGALALELAMTEEARIGIDQNGLSRCVNGHLVYEPDTSQAEFPFPQRLAQGGLSSFVAAPLLFESQVFGVLVAARRQAHGFTSPDCEFLRQLSEQVALAAHQAQLHGALKQAYDDLRLTQQAVMQQERLRALGQMASGIAHDISNAISPAALYTESLLEKEPNLSARTREYLETIRGAVDDVAQTVARMREFYRQREPQLTLAPVRMNGLLAEVVNLTRARWNDMPQQRGTVIELVMDLSPDLPAIMGVESEIREALTNLMLNAVDAMPDGGTLILRTRLREAAEGSADSSESREVCVEVVDTGVGMDEDTRRRCMEPFFTTKGERGTGLGLAMVYGVVQRHNAGIQIESTVGKGTTVRLSFAVPRTPAACPGQPPGAYAVPERLRILIVDDDPVLLKSLRDTLESDGHVIVTAHGGQEGIDTFRTTRDGKEPFAVVITDLGMPYVDGGKVASGVKELSPFTPVILLTGWGQRLVAEGDVPPHVDRVLNKPPKLRDLREALAHCCQLARS